MSKIKKNKFQYILLPIAIAVWGYIIYKVFFYVERVEHSSIKDRVGLVDPVEVEIPDTYILLNNYRDPFSSDIMLAEVDTATPEPSSNDTINPKNTMGRLSCDKKGCPEVTYKGCIMNSEKSIDKAFIQIGNSTYSVSVRDTVQGLQVEKLFTDSIKVSFNDNIYTFHKAYEF